MSINLFTDANRRRSIIVPIGGKSHITLVLLTLSLSYIHKMFLTALLTMAKTITRPTATQKISSNARPVTIVHSSNGYNFLAYWTSAEQAKSSL